MPPLQLTNQEPYPLLGIYQALVWNNWAVLQWVELWPAPPKKKQVFTVPNHKNLTFHRCDISMLLFTSSILYYCPSTPTDYWMDGVEGLAKIVIHSFNWPIRFYSSRFRAVIFISRCSFLHELVQRLRRCISYGSEISMQEERLSNLVHQLCPE